MFGFTVRAFGCTVAVSASCAEGERALEQWVFPSLPREAYRAGDLALHIENLAGGLAVSVNGAPAGLALDEPRLALEVIRALDEAVVARLTELRAVHAGAVGWRGRALLLPGRTHAGKSSLTAELLRRGATYLSDEYALIDGEGRVQAYPRPLLVRNGSPEQRAVPPEAFGAKAERERLPVGWIVPLQYAPGAVWQVHPRTQSEALMTLLRNTPHVLKGNPEMVETFGRAVARARCWEGRRGEATEAADAILRLIEEQG